MSSLHAAVEDYLAMRRALGFKLDREAALLPQFADFINDRGERHVSTDAAVAWATLPARSPAWWAGRLQIVRGFASYAHAIDPANEVPAADLLPRVSHRATPHFYSHDQIDALIAAAGTLRTPLRVATMQTLLGLLAVTGMRVGEVVGLDHDDFDARDGFLLVRGAKFGKSRELALHPTTVAARGSRTCATASRSRPCSTAIEQTTIRGAGWRCWPPTSATSTRPRPIGICQPRLSSCSAPPTGWSATPSASELIGLTRSDLHLGHGPHVNCVGKGRKQRMTPLTTSTVTILREWLRERQGGPTDPLFPSRTGAPLSRDALEHRLAHHAATAARLCPQLNNKRITAHVLRHTAAMRLLQAGIDTTVIALWLGHEQADTTQIYLHADLALKEQALARTKPVEATPGRYRPPDTLLAFLEAL